MKQFHLWPWFKWTFLLSCFSSLDLLPLWKLHFLTFWHPTVFKNRHIDSPIKEILDMEFPLKDRISIILNSLLSYVATVKCMCNNLILMRLDIGEHGLMQDGIKFKESFYMKLPALKDKLDLHQGIWIHEERKG